MDQTQRVYPSGETHASTSAMDSGGHHTGGVRQRASFLELVKRLGDQFQPFGRLGEKQEQEGVEVGSALIAVRQQEVDQEALEKRWRARTRKVAMGVILAVGQKLASRSTADSKTNEAEALEKEGEVASSELIQNELLSIRLKLAKLDKESRSGAFLGAEGAGEGEGGGRVEALDALLSQRVIPNDVLQLLVLLSPHSGTALASQKNGEEKRLVNYDADLRKLLTGFVPCSKEHLSFATSSCRVLDLYAHEAEVEKENLLLSGEVGMTLVPSSLSKKTSKFFSESEDRVQSELHATTSGDKDFAEEDESFASSKLLSVGSQGRYLVPPPFRPDPFECGDRDGESLIYVDESKPAYFTGVLERFPVQKSKQEKLLELQVQMQSEGRMMGLAPEEDEQRLHQGRGQRSGTSTIDKVVEMMNQGWLASEIDLAPDQSLYLRQQTGAQAKVDFELVKDLISVLRGFLHVIPKLSQSRFYWADYVSSQSYFMEFVKVGVAHHNLKCLVQSLQGFDEGMPGADQITQAFAKSMETILLVIDGEISRLQASRRSDLDKSELEGKGKAVGNDYSFMNLSVSELFEMTQLLRSQIVAVASFCGCFTSFEAIRKNPRLLQTQWQLSKLPRGKDLLNYLHDKCIHADGPEQEVLNYLFQNTLKPFVQQIHECIFQQSKIEKDGKFVDDYSTFLDAMEKGDTSDSGFGLALPSFLEELSNKIQMSYFQYNILKEFEHCIPLLSFMEKLCAYHWDIKGSTLSSPSSIQESFVQHNLEGHSTRLATGTSQILTLDADQLDSTRGHYKTVALVADNAIKSMLDYLSQKRTFQRAASQTASKAKLLTEERTISKLEEEETLRSMMKKKEQLKLAEELKSAAAIYQAAKVAAENAEREADRLRLTDESQRRSAMIQEASAILKEEAALRMKRVQKEIDRLNWRRRRLEGTRDLQPKKLFDFGGKDSNDAADSSNPLPTRSIPATPERDEELDDSKVAFEEDATKVPVESAPVASTESKDRDVVSEGESNEKGSGEQSSSRQAVDQARQDKKMESSVELNASKNVGEADPGQYHGKSELDINKTRGITGDPDKSLVSSVVPGKEGLVTLKDPEKNRIFDAPLPEAIHVCIVQQIELNYSCISKLCVRYFLEELNLLDYFSLMRQFYLIEAGDFGHSFLSHIVEKGLLADSARLFEKDVNAAFDIAVQNMPYSSPLVNNFEIQFIGEEAAMFAGGNIHVLDCIELKYKASFPFSLFFNGEAETRYQKLFSFFLCLRRSGFVLNEIWHFILSLQRELRRGKEDDETSSIQEEILAMLQGSHHEMSHLLTMLESYICTNIHCNLSLGFQNELMDPKLTESGNICQVHQLHQQFLSKCLDCCFLSPRHQPVLNIVYTALQTILDVQTLLRAEVDLWDLQSHLLRAQARFRNATKSLFQILKHKGMGEVLVQFDFNSFYENQG